MVNVWHLVTNLNCFLNLQPKKERQRGRKRERNQPIRVAPRWTCTHPPGCTWRWPRVLSPQGQTVEACRRTLQRAAVAGRWLGTWPVGFPDPHRWPAAGTHHCWHPQCKITPHWHTTTAGVINQVYVWSILNWEKGIFKMMMMKLTAPVLHCVWIPSFSYSTLQHLQTQVHAH